MTDDVVSNGLLICGLCGTPKQTQVEILGELRTVPVACKCESLKIAEENELRRKKSRFYSAMSSASAKCGIEVSADGVAWMPEVASYVEKWQQMFDENIGLLLWGDVGTGKTTNAALIKQALHDRYIPCLMTRLSNITGFDTPDFSIFDLLILDDFGAERESEFSVERTHRIIDDRINSHRPMVITTNLTLPMLKAEQSDIRLKRLYDRILSVCVPVFFGGDSFRKRQQAQRLKKALELLK